MRPHELRDDQWDLIRSGLPGRAGSVDVTAANNRRFVEAVIHRYCTGIPWRDLPESFGDWNNTHRRWSRWARIRVWGTILALLSTGADNEYAMIDSTIVRAHQHSAGAKKKPGKTWRSGKAKVA
jgi:transposase